MNFRHSLNRLLQSVPFDRNINVVKDPAFRQSNETFKTAMRELETLGNGEVDHYPQINLSDLRKIYNFMSCDSPKSLADKVQFDIRFYFCRRGCENMHAMTKDTFEICVDCEGNEFVHQARGELNKNHNETDREGYTVFMPAHAGSELCPVAAFKNYVSHLNPMCDSIWQRPLDSVASTQVVWYSNRPIGVNTLATFMRRLSEKCSLSKTYSNHSVRVTGVTLLCQLRFGRVRPQICVVDGCVWARLRRRQNAHGSFPHSSIGWSTPSHPTSTADSSASASCSHGLVQCNWGSTWCKLLSNR